MDRQYPSDYAGLEYPPQQMMYSVAPGQQVVGPPLVSVPGGPASMPPPHLWPTDPHQMRGHPQGGNAPNQSGPGPHRGAMAEAGGHHHGHGHHHHHHGHHHHGPANGDVLEELLGPFPVVRLRGLPFEAQVRDIILFFQGIGVLDVLMTTRGEAVVVFNTVMDCQMALGRDRQNMGRRYIEVFQAKRYDYYNAVAHHWAGGDGHDGRHHHGHRGARPNHRMGPGSDKEHQGPPGQGGPNGNGGAGAGPNGTGGSRETAIAASERAQNSGILKLRGLPFSSNKQDITQFFEGFTIRPEGIHFVFRADGRLTGEAFVHFTSAEEARGAHRAKDRSTIGSRYVEIFPTTPEECARLCPQSGGGSGAATGSGASTSNPQGSSNGGSSASSSSGSSTSSGSGGGSSTTIASTGSSPTGTASAGEGNGANGAGAAAAAAAANGTASGAAGVSS